MRAQGAAASTALASRTFELAQCMKTALAEAERKADESAAQVWQLTSQLVEARRGEDKIAKQNSAANRTSKQRSVDDQEGEDRQMNLLRQELDQARKEIERLKMGAAGASSGVATDADHLAGAISGAKSDSGKLKK